MMWGFAARFFVSVTLRMKPTCHRHVCKGPTQRMAAREPGICQGRQALKLRVSLEPDNQCSTAVGFFRRVGRSLLGAGAAFHFAPAFGWLAVSSKSDPHRDVSRPGRLGNPEMTMLDDMRLDPRVRKAMSGMPAGDPAALLPQVSLSSSYEDCLQWVAAMETLHNEQDSAMLATMPDFSDVVRLKRRTITVSDEGDEIDLFIEKTKRVRWEFYPVLFIYTVGVWPSRRHMAAGATRWRKTLATTGACGSCG